MKTYYITYTKENREKNKSGLKTMTRRVIEKIDQYKNIQPDDILVTRKNRFSKEELDRHEVVKTWMERAQDISLEDIKKEGVLFNTNDIDIEDYREDESALREDWKNVWDSINKKRGYEWSTNPKVRVIEYKIIKSMEG